MKFTFGNLPTIGWDEPTAKLVDLACRAEAAGFDRFGVSDWKFYQDCFVVMTACLQATSTLEVESLVTEPYVRNPALTAAALATMDDLSGGRAILGIGAGVESSSRVWTAPWGHERPHPVQAVREAVDVSRRMWRGEEVTLDGTVVRVHQARLSFKGRPDTRIMIAARSQRMLQLAGELADIVHLASFFGNVGHHRDNLAQVRTGAERAGRASGSFEIDISLPCSISRDRDAARTAARRPAAIGILWTSAQDEYALKGWRRPSQFSVPPAVVAALSGWNFRSQPQLPHELAQLISDDILDEYALAGTAEECAERLVNIQQRLPEVTGLRIYAVPPLTDGKLLYDGYVDMLAEMEKMIAIVRARPVSRP
jgi:5,10-methylenetetrahydromethanopterin reductase